MSCACACLCCALSTGRQKRTFSPSCLVNPSQEALPKLDAIPSLTTKLPSQLITPSVRKLAWNNTFPIMKAFNKDFGKPGKPPFCENRACSRTYESRTQKAKNEEFQTVIVKHFSESLRSSTVNIEDRFGRATTQQQCDHWCHFWLNSGQKANNVSDPAFSLLPRLQRYRASLYPIAPHVSGNAGHRAISLQIHTVAARVPFGGYRTIGWGGYRSNIANRSNYLLVSRKQRIGVNNFWAQKR